MVNCVFFNKMAKRVFLQPSNKPVKLLFHNKWNTKIFCNKTMQKKNVEK